MCLLVQAGPFATADARLNGLRCIVPGCQGAIRVDVSLLRGSESLPAGVVGFSPVEPGPCSSQCNVCRAEMGSGELAEKVEKAVAAARLAEKADEIMQQVQTTLLMCQPALVVACVRAGVGRLCTRVHLWLAASRAA